MRRLLFLCCLSCAVIAKAFVIDSFFAGTAINIAVGGTAPPTQGPIAQTTGDATDAIGLTRQAFIWKTLGSNATEYVQATTSDGKLNFFNSANLTTATTGQWALRYRGIPVNPAFETNLVVGGYSAIYMDGFTVDGQFQVDLRVTDNDYDSITVTKYGVGPGRVCWIFGEYSATINWTAITDIYIVFRGTPGATQTILSIETVPLPPPEQISSVGFVLCP